MKWPRFRRSLGAGDPDPVAADYVNHDKDDSSDDDP